MSARKAKRRPKARKQKLIHAIDGHKLTVAQHAEYLEQLEEVRKQHPEWQSWTGNHERRALSDCQHRWRPSVQASQRFRKMDLYRRTQDAMFTLASLENFPLDIGGAGVVRIGNDLIKHIADELDAVSQELRTIHSAIAKETQI